MIVLDTTVLVYAVGAEHPLREPCRSLIEAIGRGTIEATTTGEVIQEFAHLRARRRGRADAAALARGFVDLLTPLLMLEEPDVRAGLELFGSHLELGAFDALLAALALRAGAGVVSADHAFAAVSELGHHDPASPGFLAGLGLD